MTKPHTKNKSDTSATNSLTLVVKKREIFGKKLKAVRAQNKLPANIFGENFTSQAVTVAFKDFIKVFKKAGETQIVTLTLDNQKLPILIKNVQYHPVSRLILHIDLRKVDLTKKIETEVPIKLIGESPAVGQNKGVLLTLAESVMVEALPQAIPTAIEVNITHLKELNDEIKVKDLPTSADYVFKDDAEKVIVRISEHKEESIETQVVAPETVEVTTEKKDEAEEGESDKGEKKEKTEKPEKSEKSPAPANTSSKDEGKKEEKK